MKFNNKVLFFILCIFALVFIAGGCSPLLPKPAAAEQVIRYNIGAEPATLDPPCLPG